MLRPTILTNSDPLQPRSPLKEEDQHASPCCANPTILIMPLLFVGVYWMALADSALAQPIQRIEI